MAKHVMVIGDVILDEYVGGTRLGLAAETPTIVAKQTEVHTYVGGAGLVVRHLLRLGCEVTLLSVHGPQDQSPKNLMRNSSDQPYPDELDRLNDLSYPLEGWNMTRKRRFFVDGYKLLQFDVLNDGKADEAIIARSVRSCISTIMSWGVDALVFCDNRHGMSIFMTRLMQELRQQKDLPKGLKVYVDSQVSQAKESNLENYEMADFFLMNERELDAYLLEFSRQYDREDDIYDLNLKQKMNRASRWLDGDVIVKLGDRGSVSLIDSNFDTQPPHVAPVHVVDTCGAGDAFMAAFVATGDLEKANKWAGMSTTYKGTIVPQEGLL